MKKGEYDDLTNIKFGKLTVIGFNSHCNRRRTYWNCVCECGNKVVVESSHLKSGHTKSCGCISKNRMKNINYINGLSNTRLNRIYRNMLNRCRNCNIEIYRFYGGRGIKVCDEWLPENNGFLNFCNWAFSKKLIKTKYIREQDIHNFVDNIIIPELIENLKDKDNRNILIFELLYEQVMNKAIS